MPDTTALFKRQLPRNSLFQVLAFVTQVVIGVLLVPYLVRQLGRAAYGLIPIAGMMTEYVNLISHSIASAVNRFLAVALQRDDTEEANRVFNTAFFSYLAIGLLQVPLFMFVIYHAGTLFSIPGELFRDAILLLMCSAVVYLVNLLASVFAVPMYANNRLDICRIIDIGRCFFRLTGVVTLFLAFGPALRYVGYVDLGIGLVLLVVQVVVGKRLAPALVLRRRFYDWHKIHQLAGMSGWLLLNSIGALLFLRIDIWLCNRFVSAEAAGDYAAVQQWAALIRHGGMIVSGVIAPMIVIYYAKSDMEHVVRLCQVAVRVLSLTLAVPISMMCVFSAPLLRLWLGESFVPLAPLMALLLCHLVINVGVMPLFNIQVALNKVRWPGLVTLLMGVVNLGVALSLVTYLHWGVYGIAIAGAIVLAAKNAVFTPLYAAWILHRPWHTFITSYLSGLGLLIVLLGFGYAINRYATPTSWMNLILLAFVIGVVGFAAVWAALPGSDRRLMIDLVPQRIRRMMARVVAT